MTGEDLAAIRLAAGLTQTDLARRVGIGRHAVSYWENKPRVDLRAGAVVRMGTVLDLPKPPARGYRLSWAERADQIAEAAYQARLAAQKAREAEHAKRRRVICGAKTRKGTPCRCKSEPGKRRCKYHGGMSTGARTPEGLDRIREAQRLRWARWRKIGAKD